MSLRANIEHLSAAAGIEAVTVVSPATGAREFRGDNYWSPILDTSMALLDKTDQKTIRLVIGAHTVVLQREGEETVAVVLPTGHAIAKSLRRMIRRLSRKPRGPVVRAALSHHTSSAPAGRGTGAAGASEKETKPLTPWG